MVTIMLASFLITFREALEAALIIGIIAAYVAKLGRKDLNRYINIGIISALVASLAVAFLFKVVYGELKGTAEQLFEGAAALTAAIVLTYMIFWMAQNSKQIKGEVQEKIDLSISKGLMGYNGNPSLTEVIAYIGYWIIIGMFVYRTYKLGTTVKDGSRYPQD